MMPKVKGCTSYLVLRLLPFKLLGNPRQFGTTVGLKRNLNFSNSKSHAFVLLKTNFGFTVAYQ